MRGDMPRADYHEIVRGELVVDAIEGIIASVLSVDIVEIGASQKVRQALEFDDEDTAGRQRLEHAVTSAVGKLTKHDKRAAYYMARGFNTPERVASLLVLRMSRAEQIVAKNADGSADAMDAVDLGSVSKKRQQLEQALVQLAVLRLVAVEAAEQDLVPSPTARESGKIS